MDSLFDNLTLVDTHQDLARNIIFLMESENLFDDLSDSPIDWEIAQMVELDHKPSPFESPVPAIHRPFEDAMWDNVITYPFKNWMRSRFSDGSFGVWYGADTLETSIYESAHHWYTGLLSDAGFNRPGAYVERKAYWVRCDAVLINLKEKALSHPQLVDQNDYSYTQTVGARLHHEGHPGLLTRSTRNLSGDTFAILKSQVLSAPRHAAFYSYEIADDSILVRLDGKSLVLKIPKH
ncbi:RES family NAD+ phosphorylase [Polynucleobacter corsicus]|uniref:RES family NAD+ phosphorylase n=1 Tax=Polynucleobacter corsicus TaxID=2081042 RepID=UPI001BFDC429|nr:RES family NAD+ phosphorylase [Polynucleobacter corsicus]QWE18988.1 RES family NAD+ phosphorylase [Polynucleobacter corsicus]